MAALLREAVRQRWVNRLFEAIANPRGCTSVIGTTTPAWLYRRR